MENVNVRGRPFGADAVLGSGNELGGSSPLYSSDISAMEIQPSRKRTLRIIPKGGTGAVQGNVSGYDSRYSNLWRAFVSFLTDLHPSNPKRILERTALEIEASRTATREALREITKSE